MQKPQTIITPPSRFSLGLRELWAYRELFYFFTWRDIKVKYKQTYLGIAWAILQPLALMLLLLLVFRRFSVYTGSMQFPIFILSGIIFWNFFQSAVSNASESMISGSHIIKKIYFPRLIIPCSALLTALFDFVIAFILLLIFCVFYRQSFSVNAILFFPLAILWCTITSFGLGVLLSSLNVRFRDFRYVVPFLLQLLFFATQVIFDIKEIQQPLLKMALSLNPMNGVIEIFRYPFTSTLDLNVLSVGIASTIIFTFIGVYHFRKTEAFFADLS